jgi:aminoglycoside phosphotransferase family enzyme/predicted kinase
MIGRRTCDERRPMSSFPDHLHTLLFPRAYPHPVRAVDLIETHISWVLLSGKFAYKVKRPVHYSFIDLRSPEQRRFLCNEEVRLNRRFAPELYLGVRAVRRRCGEARIGGSGRIIEHAVKMRRFPRSGQLDALLGSRRIAPAELESFGGELAAMHARLPVAEAGEEWGRPAAQLEGIRRNAAECVRAAGAIGDAGPLRALQGRLEAWADTALRLLERRFADGRVRECHGDLHAGNIVRLGARLRPFDCLEFDPALRWIDVADELSFLLADLDARQRPLHAQAFLGGYLTVSGDYQACLLLPVFRAHRALVRAKVMALSASAESARAAIGEARRWHERYLRCAERALAPPPPRLVLMSGLSGSGKTSLARRLAPVLGAVHVRSDIERKRLVGLAPLTRSASAVGQGLYGGEVTTAVYERLAECAADSLAGGYTTIVDATFGIAAERARFRALARRLGLPICMVHCHAPEKVLERRILERSRRADDPSEADFEVLHWQEAHFTPPLPHEADAVLDAVQLPAKELAHRISAAGASGQSRSPSR